ncbi:hypothetical protein NKG05_22335 [Oerskovia sp. M15]
MPELRCSGGAGVTLTTIRSSVRPAGPSRHPHDDFFHDEVMSDMTQQANRHHSPDRTRRARPLSRALGAAAAGIVLLLATALGAAPASAHGATSSCRSGATVPAGCRST